MLRRPRLSLRSRLTSLPFTPRLPCLVLVRRYRITVNGKVYETSIQVVSQ